MAIRKMDRKLSDAELNAPDLDEGEPDVEHYPLPDGSEIGDEYLRGVWQDVVKEIQSGPAGEPPA